MNKNLPETSESPFCFSAAKTFRCGCVHLQLKLLTGQHIIAANNLLDHLILWYITWQCWHSTQYRWALPRTAFSYSFIVFTQNSILGGQNFKFFLGACLAVKQANTLLKPPLHIFKFCCYGNVHNNYVYEGPNLKCKPTTTPLDIFLDQCLLWKYVRVRMSNKLATEREIASYK